MNEINLGTRIKELINENGYNSIKLLDKRSFLEAPGLALNDDSFTKENKKVLIIGTEPVFDYMPMSSELKGELKDVYSRNLRELSRIRSDFDYDKGLVDLAKNKGFFVARDSTRKNLIRNENEYLNYMFDTFKTVNDVSKENGIDFEAICSDYSLLAKFKSSELPANIWEDIGMHSLSQLYYGWSELTLKHPTFENDYEEAILKKNITQVSKTEIKILNQILEKLNNKGNLESSDFSDFHPKKFRPNEILFITTDQNINLRFDPEQNRLIKFNGYEKMKEIWHQTTGYSFHGIKPKNRFQEAQMELMMSGADVIVFFGAAGSGKTLFPLAFGAHACKEPLKTTKGKYDSVVKKLFQNYNPEKSPKRKDNELIVDHVTVYRPTETVQQREVGFLPGDLNEKMEPLVAPIYENLALIASKGYKSDSIDKDKLDRFMSKFKSGPVLYLRGASFHNEITIIDECQNLTDDTLRTILTRTTSSSKTILTGDPTQDDVTKETVSRAIYYNSLTRFVRQYCGPSMPDFLSVLFMPPRANERGFVSKYFL